MKISDHHHRLRNPTQFLPDLDDEQPCVVVLFDIDVDGEMGIDISHFVFVTLRNTDDEIVDEGFDCSKSCDILAGAVVNFDRDFF